MLGPTLRGDRISLEPARAADAALRRQLFSTLDLTRLYTSPGVPSPAQDAASFDRDAHDASVVLWSIVLNGETIGQSFLFALDSVRRQAQSGMWIADRANWGKGYGSDAVRLRTAYAFRDLGLERIETSSIKENIGMHRALERSHFRRIGVRTHAHYAGGLWHDAYIFEVLRDEWREP
ncbi:MAG: hypothetical protein NVS2B16_17770 [Chloroflexota bacterium]